MNDQVTPEETKIILSYATQALFLDGDYVELGCYRGDTSILLGKLLSQHSSGNQPNLPQSRGQNQRDRRSYCGKPVEKMCRNTTDNVDNMCKNPQNSVENLRKTLWIYDSFAGLPAKTAEDNSGAGQHFQAGELFVTKHEVVTKLKKAGLHNVIVKKAWFDELTDTDLPAQIAFAFLDGDLYSSIKTSLKLVAPRLTPQGFILVHDYNNPELPGSSRAVDEFLSQHSNFHLQNRATVAILRQK